MEKHILEKLLTIVVPAYNVEKYIKNCLDSFIDLSVLRSLEILIVDDGSTDSTASLAHTYEQKYHTASRCSPRRTEAMDLPSTMRYRVQQESILRWWMVMTGWTRAFCHNLYSF